MSSLLQDHLLDYLGKVLSGQSAAVPAGGHLIWRWFADLGRTRSSNGYGPNPISYAEILAYAALHRWPIEPRHIDLLLALDLAWLRWARAEVATPEGAPAHRPSTQLLTPESFDAVFS